MYNVYLFIYLFILSVFIYFSIKMFCMFVSHIQDKFLS